MEQAVAPAFAIRSDPERRIRTPKTAELVALKLRSMIVSGELKDGDRLPNEAELMELFSVSRQTLREAIRVLEAERLVEVRRGSRSGAKVCVPGPEVVARPAALVLQLSEATVADVYRALEAIEPPAARLLAEEGTDAAFDQLEQFLDEILPEAYASGRLGSAAAQFHLRMVQLSGSATLALIAGMVNEILERNYAALEQEYGSAGADKNYRLFVRSQRRFIKLLRARDGAGAFHHWHKHMGVARQFVMRGREDLLVQDLLD
ncbi:GntR family transcriptional regulator [Gordonia pseudamarae]|jgi:GntR family transcriptional repressor for pyruvate dehydrogenase complex|uniref:GntR family transcriptional regulator n=1 Tax=Gordonia pseudamarae TaxID=2831662 RepID=A0ABX6IEC3_9ACTN|nr:MULTISPECIES: GntR family transcriptional regulator [Gordonia]MBD0021767.1 FadR family transcriptional regulator [Gordonia sp. (in: high G+C Gram-positive bacteria)]QHN25265.1 GntR family transcriptional regulator [Gordonia pseudamarae]QHN34197.1 GntR family transcriptional regulator [Gordonia pseudamarae]